MAEAVNMGDAKAEGTTVAVQSDSGMLSTVRRFTSDPAVRRAVPTFAAIIFAVAGLFAFVFMQAPQRTTLYASLPEAEKARVVEALINSGVEVTLDPTTGDVLVPTNDFHEAKMSLAAQGLPTSVPDGYASVGEIPMGSSRSVENVRLKQSQEIELARSIGEIDGVVSARVHLAIPEKSVFARNATPPTASVFIQMNNGRTLGSQQVDAVVHLVSSSVPNMAKTDVTVVDQFGSLLSKPTDDMASLLSDSQLQHRIRLENIYRNRVISLVSPIVGAGNVTSQINLDIDYTRSETTEERVDPEGNALRSEQKSVDMTSKANARGIPGATANQPPLQSEIDTVQGDDAAPKGGVATQSSNEVRNYEVSRTVSTTKSPSTRIVRIQAAVLVRDKEVVNPETGLKEVVPFTPEKLAEIEKLVANAIGIDAERGDQLTVSSSAFVSAIEGVTKAWYDMEWAINLMKQGMTLLIMGVVVMGVIRPLIGRIMVPAAVGAPGEAMVSLEDDLGAEAIEVQEGESLEDIKAKLKPKKAAISAEMLDTANTYDDKVAVIRMIVGDEAGRVSNVFKSMMEREIG